MPGIFSWSDEDTLSGAEDADTSVGKSSSLRQKLNDAHDHVMKTLKGDESNKTANRENVPPPEAPFLKPGLSSSDDLFLEELLAMRTIKKTDVLQRPMDEDVDEENKPDDAYVDHPEGSKAPKLNLETMRSFSPGLRFFADSPSSAPRVLTMKQMADGEANSSPHRQTTPSPQLFLRERRRRLRQLANTPLSNGSLSAAKRGRRRLIDADSEDEEEFVPSILDSLEATSSVISDQPKDLTPRRSKRMTTRKTYTEDDFMPLAMLLDDRNKEEKGERKEVEQEIEQAEEKKSLKEGVTIEDDDDMPLATLLKKKKGADTEQKHDDRTRERKRLVTPTHTNSASKRRKSEEQRDGDYIVWIRKSTVMRSPIKLRSVTNEKSLNITVPLKLAKMEKTIEDSEDDDIPLSAFIKKKSTNFE